MRFFVALVVFCLALGSATPRTNRNVLANDRHEGSKLGMYAGTATTIEKHPYLVRLYGEGYFWCAASIVSQTWVVTSAMCTTLAGNDPSNFKIVAGSNDTEGGTTYAISQIVRHPKFNEDNYDYSYSCIQIDGQFTWGETMSPLVLPPSNPSSGTSLTVAGWGAVDADADDYSKLYEGTMKWMPKLYCTILYDLTGWFLTDRMGCALNKRKTTLCTGDIGDPFTEGNVYYGHFIYPYPLGDDCDSDSKAVLVAKIYPVVDWIQNITGATVAD